MEIQDQASAKFNKRSSKQCSATTGSESQYRIRKTLMIFGNPSELAIQIEIVPEWCSARFLEGIFCVYLDRQRLNPSHTHTDTLTVATRQFLSGPTANVAAVSKPCPLPDGFIGKDGEDLFDKLYELTYPSNATDPSVQNCWNYVISPDAMTDRGFHLFIYRDDSSEVLLGGSIDAGIVVSTSMPIGSTFAIARKANDYVLRHSDARSE